MQFGLLDCAQVVEQRMGAGVARTSFLAGNESEAEFFQDHSVTAPYVRPAINRVLAPRCFVD